MSTTRFSNLSTLSLSLKRHKTSHNHVQCFYELKMFGTKRIDSLIDSQARATVSRHNELVKKSGMILESLIDIVCFLGKGELAFRAHDESSSSLNKGHYLNTLELISEYDTLLETHMKNALYLKKLQNDLIPAVADVIIDEIQVQIDSAPFVSITLDETTDVMSKSQLSTLIRYVFNGLACERFIGFTDVSKDRTANGLFEHVVETTKKHNFPGKLVGQTYNGASVMSGNVNGLQKKYRKNTHLLFLPTAMPMF